MSPKPKLVIWGAAGHALVVADILRLQNQFEIVGFLDDVNAGRKGEIFDGFPILGGREQIQDLQSQGVSHAIIGIGDGHARLRLAPIIEAAGLQFATAIHPAATVAASSNIGAGSVIVAGAIINPACQLGRHCIVNTGATVDHECRLGDGVHIGPGAHLGGRVEIGDGTWIGIGAVIRDRIQIGSESMIGAGAVVVKDIPARIIAFGVPARVRRQN